MDMSSREYHKGCNQGASSRDDRDKCDEFLFTTCICLWSGVRVSTYNMHRLVIATKHPTFKCKLAVRRKFFSIFTNQRLVDAEIAINGFMCCRECPDFIEGLTPMTAQVVTADCIPEVRCVKVWLGAQPKAT